MAIPSAKELKQLAAACRKAGIKSLKCEGFEFTLTDELPSKRRSSKTERSGAMASPVADDFEEEALTQDQLLMWSSQSQVTDEQ